MSRQNLLNRIRDLLTKFAFQIQIDNKSLQTDLNRIAEDILLPVFRRAYGLPDLVNLNVENTNAAAVDLGDKTKRVAFQITAQATNAKILDTLQKISDHKRYEDYDTFYVFGIVPKNDTMSVKGWKKAIDGNFDFNSKNVHGPEDLRARIGGLQIEDIEFICSVLEKNLGEGDKYSFAALKGGIFRSSDRTVRQVLDARTVVRRPEIERKLKEFLASSVRYGFLTGQSAVGKSTLLALETKHVSHPTLFATIPPERHFSLGSIADEIRTEMKVGAGDMEWPHIIGPWEPESVGLADGNEAEPLLIILDGLESADTEHLAVELARLDRSIARTDPRLVKVLLSCRDTELERILNHRMLPFYTRAADLRGVSLFDSRTVEIGNFDSRELDAALTEIGAIELLNETDNQGRVDDHIASMRKLLEHPGTFEHFAALYATGGVTEKSEETWSTLLEKRLDQCFQKVEQLTGNKPGKVKAILLEFVSYCRKEKIREFTIPIDEAREHLPALFESSRRGLSLHAALVASGVMSSGSDVSFWVTDAGGFLLSVELEEELRGAAENERQAVVSGWLQERWNYWPVADGFLSLVDRLTTIRPRQNDLLEIILETMASQHHEAHWFRLMKPSVLEFLFQKAQDDKRERSFYEYRDAARNVRYSPTNEKLLRRNAHDDFSPLSRELAAELIGLYELPSFAPDLIDLLTDEDENVRRAAFDAFRNLGPDAIEPLVAKLEDASTPDRVKSSVAGALVSVGYRNNRVSDILANELDRDDIDESTALSRNLLYLAVHLRDKRQTEAVLNTLAAASDPHLIRVAANYFSVMREGPQGTYDTLVNKLTQIESESDPELRWSSSSIVAALAGLDRVRAGKLLLSAKERIADDKSKSWPAATRDIVFKYDIHEVYPALYKAAIKAVDPKKIRPATIMLLEDLGKVSSPAGLCSLCEAAKKTPAGTAKMVEALLPHIGDDEYEHGDRLNRIQHLGTVIKAQDPDFPNQALSLLPRVSPFGIDRLGAYYWILGDTSCEKALLENFRATIARKEELSNGRKVVAISGAARPLGTCGTHESVRAILEHISRDSDGLSRHFGEQVLLPLLLRGQCTPDEIAAVAADESADWVGRAICLQVLRNADYEAHVELFKKLLETSSNESILREAVFGLGISGNDAAIRPLRQMLRRDDISATLKGYTARSLAAGLKASVALPDIERAFAKLPKYEDIPVQLFATAFMAIGEKSSVKLLEDLDELPMDVKRYISEALSSLSIDAIDRGEFAKVLQDTSGSLPRVFQEQSFVLKAILRKARPELLEVVVEDLERRRLNPQSQSTIVNHLRLLTTKASVDKSLIVRLATPIVTSIDHSVRYRALAVLDFLSEAVCNGIFERIVNAADADERTIACAVESLGFWNSDPAVITEYRFDSREFVRNAADLALAQQSKRKMLEFHLKNFEHASGMKRLASYLCLCENGDGHTIRRLQEIGNPHSVLYVQADHVADRIEAQMRRTRDSIQQKNALKTRYTEHGHVKLD